MFDQGYLTLARWRGTPIRAHWSMPLGALVFGGFSFAPAFWVAFFVLVLVHELGHAVLARRYGARVLSVDVTGFGGLCRWSGVVSDYERAKIAWGGVLAQAVLLVAALAVLATLGRPTSVIGAQLVSAFVTTNLLIMGLNLLPLRPLDGKEAWLLASDLLARWRGRRLLRAVGLSGRRPASPRPSPSAGRSPSRADAAASEQPGAAARLDSRQAIELAEMLRRIGTEAGRARRGERGDRER
jgi:Zn-dependent protease